MTGRSLTVDNSCRSAGGERGRRDATPQPAFVNQLAMGQIFGVNRPIPMSDIRGTGWRGILPVDLMSNEVVSLHPWHNNACIARKILHIAGLVRHMDLLADVWEKAVHMLTIKLLSRPMTIENDLAFNYLPIGKPHAFPIGCCQSINAQMECA